MDEMTYSILKIVVSVCVALISAFVVPYLRRLAQSEKLESLYKVVEVAVQAAEQTIEGYGKGEEKKQMVLAYVSEWLGKHSIKITPEQLDVLIESAVYKNVL